MKTKWGVARGPAEGGHRRQQRERGRGNAGKKKLENQEGDRATQSQIISMKTVG